MIISRFLRDQITRLSVYIATLVITFTIAGTLSAAPGAHGPNGEHLDQQSTDTVELTPRFETFTETFELVGELTADQLIIFLHDYKTNAPIVNAGIEVELADLSTQAVYDKTRNAYVVSNLSLLKSLNQAGDHQLLFTILTESSGDLMVAEYHMSSAEEDDHQEDEHHEHFPWGWSFTILVALIVGFTAARMFTGGAA